MNIIQITTVFLQGEKPGEDTRYKIAIEQLENFKKAKDKQIALNFTIATYAAHCLNDK